MAFGDRSWIAVLAAAWGVGGCAASDPPREGPASRPADPLAKVAAIHGGVGPFAVAGYRMGRYALEALELSPDDFGLEVVHYTPQQVQYACIADGAAAATGVSVGKLDLSLVEAAPRSTRTVYRRRSDGRAITLRLTDAFLRRYLDLPRHRLEAAGAEVLTLPDEAIFERVHPEAPADTGGRTGP